MPLAAQASTCAPLEEKLNSISSLQDYLEGVTSKSARCGTTLQQGGAQAIHCYVEFQYRAQQATTDLAHLHSDLSTCFDEQIPIGAGQIVNHPDSFDQIEYCGQSHRYSLSLKDKAGLAQTLIFLSASQSLKDC
jgi:hypothetical protein